MRVPDANCSLLEFKRRSRSIDRDSTSGVKRNKHNSDADSDDDDDSSDDDNCNLGSDSPPRTR